MTQHTDTVGMKPRSSPGELLYDRLLAFALSLPGAEKHMPWGEPVAKVRGKVFVFFGRARVDDFGLSVKLPMSAQGVVAMPFATATGYGLGKSGWVSVANPAGASLPFELFQEWVLESYQAIAPKKLIKLLQNEA